MTLQQLRDNRDMTFIIEDQQQIQEFIKLLLDSRILHSAVAHFPSGFIGQSSTWRPLSSAIRLVAMRDNGPALDGFIGTVFGRHLYARWP